MRGVGDSGAGKRGVGKTILDATLLNKTLLNDGLHGTGLHGTRIIQSGTMPVRDDWRQRSSNTCNILVAKRRKHQVRGLITHLGIPGIN